MCPVTLAVTEPTIRQQLVTIARWRKSLAVQDTIRRSSIDLEEEHSAGEDDFFEGITESLNEEEFNAMKVELYAMKVQEGAKFGQNNVQLRVAETQCYGCRDMGHRMAACPRKKEIIAKFKKEGGPDMERLYQVCESLQKRFDGRGKFQGRRGSSTKSF